jgi:hypothetical protein
MSLFRHISSVAICGLLLLGTGAAQSTQGDGPEYGSSFAANAPAPSLSQLVPLSSMRLSPDLALAAYEEGLKNQSLELTGYTAMTVIDAELPESSQKAEFELKRRYTAPSMLRFEPVRSSGDQFVKSNVIARLLQSEVEHVQKQEQSRVAINSDNYKFSYKGVSDLNGLSVHVYDLKPRHKRSGLFRGRIYVDAATGRLVRSQGRLLKSPSVFIKKIEFVQDYETIAGFTFPVRLHSEASTRLVGKAIVNIFQSDYQPEIGTGSSEDLSTAVAYSGTN